MASASDQPRYYKTLSHDAYAVGWICALPVELTAAKGLLDIRHETLPQPANDSNNYVLGEIAGHNVVVACLPTGEYGTTSAATVATQMLSTFPRIRFGLMVGIGGGVPTTEDIRLGDVVVSNPTNGFGGVIQYDYGKTIHQGRFVRTGSLNKPPLILLTAAANLRSEHQMRANRIPQFITEMSRRYPQLSEALNIDRSADDLYTSHYGHIAGESTCEKCDRNQLQTRKPRPSQNPEIHYGLVASGNQVIKDARTRDRYAKELGIICFEMEAAGLMNHFPCLVIRGICDYSDSHKNKKWQTYAAASAAAYAKELLSVTSVPMTCGAITARRSLGPETWTVDDPARFLALSKQPEWALVQKVEQSKNIFQRLSDYDPDRTYRSHLWNRCPNTTAWILEHQSFRAWLDGSVSPFLWLTGKIGCGKTLVTSTVIEHLKAYAQDSDRSVVHFFYSHSNRSRLEARHVFESYIKQIIGHLDMFHIPCPPQPRSYIKRFYDNEQQIPAFREIIHEILVPLCQSQPGIIFVMDGLDECDRSQTLRVLEGLREIAKQSSVRVFISSREGLDLPGAIPGCAAINIAEDGSKADLRAFVEWKIEMKMKERQLTENECLLAEITETIIQKAGHMILWVSLQLDMLWDECYTDTDIRKTLDNLPRDLSTTYNRCLARISGRSQPFAKKVLPWVSIAPVPFTGSQLREAVALNPRTGIIDIDDFVPVKELVKACSHLITWDINDEIHLAHYSVLQFLEHQGGEHYSWFGNVVLEEEKDALGGLCMKHLLSPTYFQAMVPIAKPTQTAVNAGSIMQNLWTHIPYSSRLGFKKAKKVEVRLPLKGPTETRPQEPPSFFEFARGQWLPLTRDLTNMSTSWNEFEKLALERNFTWQIHPWEPLGMSMDSHFAGMLGYAIVERHAPLLSIVLRSRGLQPRIDIFRIPLHPYNNLLPIHLAARAGNSYCLVHIMGHSTFNALDENGQTALHHAAAMGHSDVIEVLLSRAMLRIDQPDKDRRTALHLAAFHGHSHIFHLLIGYRANINERDRLGQTPLHLAVANKKEKAVQALLVEGADISIIDRDCQSPLAMAAHNYDKDMMRLLLQANNPTRLGCFDDQPFIKVSTRLLMGIGTLVVLDPRMKYHLNVSFDQSPSSEEDLLFAIAHVIQPQHVGPVCGIYIDVLIESGINMRYLLVHKLLLCAAVCGNREISRQIMEHPIWSSNLDVPSQLDLSSFINHGLVSGLRQRPSNTLLNNPLVLAVEMGHIDLVEMLYDRWSPPILNNFILQNELSTLAIQHGRLQFLSKILENDWKIPHHTLSYALTCQNPKVVELLASKGVAVTCEDIFIALKNKDEPVLSSLLECEPAWHRSSPVSSTDLFSIRKLASEAQRLGRDDVLQWLVDNGSPETFLVPDPGDMSD